MGRSPSERLDTDQGVSHWLRNKAIGLGCNGDCPKGQMSIVGEVLVGGQDHRAELVEDVDELEQVVGPLTGHRQVAQFDHDPQVELEDQDRTIRISRNLTNGS